MKKMLHFYVVAKGLEKKSRILLFVAIVVLEYRKNCIKCRSSSGPFSPSYQRCHYFVAMEVAWNVASCYTSFFNTTEKSFLICDKKNKNKKKRPNIPAG